MDNFEFPTNIKQIGSIGQGLKIYIEDYVSSYLHQYADSGGYEEKIAILVGRYLVIDGQKVLFISGAIQGKFCQKEKDIYVLTEEFWEFADKQMNKYFYELEVVGFMQSQPSYGFYLNLNYANYFMNNFISESQVLFVIDPIEKVNGFYIWNENQDDLTETSGYFIYYDKNERMHEYMLDNMVSKLRVQPVANKEEDLLLEPETPEMIIKKHQANRTRKTHFEQKKLMNMLVSLSAVLFLICFIMGAGLIQNEDRITSLEREIGQINSSYTNIIAQLKQDNTLSVFAAQSDKNKLVQSETVQASLIKEDGAELVAKTAPTPAPTKAPTPEPTAEPTPVPTAVPTAVPTVEPIPIPEPKEEELPVAESQIPDTYTVQQGDNLIYISQKFYGTSKMADKIMEVNGLDDPNKIFYGKVIKLPKGE